MEILERRWVAIAALLGAGVPTSSRAAEPAQPPQGSETGAEGSLVGEPSRNERGHTDGSASEGDAAQEESSALLDMRVRVADDLLHSNAVLWSPALVGGAGLSDTGGTRQFYGGAYLEPLSVLAPRAGEWVSGMNAIQMEDGTSHEFQSEYRCPFGFGVGAGYVEPAEGGLTRFVKLSFDHTFGPIRALASAQMQDVSDTIWPGAYGAVVWEHAMGSFGHDGEQWRATVGLVAPGWHRLFAPAVEGFFVDSTVGELPGTRFLFVNAALAGPHPFLGNDARLGRGMGPQGLQLANPLGFLSAQWNRAPDTWELGQVITGRVIWEQAPNESVRAVYEGAIYPFHFDEASNFGDALFAGGFYRERPVDPSGGVSLGLSGEIGVVQASLGLDFEFQTLLPGGTAILQIPL